MKAKPSAFVKNAFLLPRRSQTSTMSQVGPLFVTSIGEACSTYRTRSYTPTCCAPISQIEPSQIRTGLFRTSVPPAFVPAQTIYIAGHSIIPRNRSRVDTTGRRLRTWPCLWPPLGNDLICGQWFWNLTFRIRH